MLATSVHSQPDPAALARTIAFNTLVQLLGRAFSLVLNAIAVIALVRYLSVEQYGSYAFISSFVLIFGFLGDFGISRVAVREMARQKADIGRLLGTSVALRVLLSIGAIVLCTGTSIILDHSMETRIGVLIASSALLVEAFKSLNILFQAELTMQYDAVVQVIMRTVETALVLWLIVSSGQLLAFLAVPIASGLVAAALTFAVVRMRFRVRLTVDPRAMKGLLVASSPLAATFFLSLVYLRADTLLLNRLIGDQAVGIYGAAYRPIDYLLLVVAALFVNAILPVLARLHGTDATGFNQVFQNGFRLLLASIVPVAVGVTIFADQLVQVAYSSQYAASAAPLRILMWASVGMFVTHYLASTLLAVNQQRTLLMPFAVGALANLAANLALIPTWSYMGAAVAICISVVVLGLLLGLALRRESGIRISILPLGRLIAANIVTGGVMLAVGQAHWLLGLLTGVLAYPSLIFACGVLTINDVRRLLRSESFHDDPPPYLSDDRDNAPNNRSAVTTTEASVAGVSGALDEYESRGIARPIQQIIGKR